MENNALGEFIKRCRKSKNVTQDQIAHELGLNRTTYASKEQKGNFLNNELDEIKRILEITDKEMLQNLPGKAISEGALAGKVIQIEAMQRVALTVLQELYSKALGITNMEAQSVIDKVLELELRKLKQE